MAQKMILVPIFILPKKRPIRLSANIVAIWMPDIGNIIARLPGAIIDVNNIISTVGGRSNTMISKISYTMRLEYLLFLKILTLK